MKCHGLAIQTSAPKPNHELQRPTEEDEFRKWHVALFLAFLAPFLGECEFLLELSVRVLGLSGRFVVSRSRRRARCAVRHAAGRRPGVVKLVPIVEEGNLGRLIVSQDIERNKILEW